MELHLMHFLIVCPLVFLAGFVDAVAGGGGLISLPAYMIAGLPVHFAIGTNKLSSGMGTTLATARFAKNGYIAWKNALLCIVTALIGSSLGAKLALQLDDYYFKRLILTNRCCTYVLVGRRQYPIDGYRTRSSYDINLWDIYCCSESIGYR